MTSHLVDTFDLEHYIVAQEKHQDGHYHLHCWIKFKKKVNFKRSDKFDYSTDDATYHPNIQGVKCNTAVIKYVTKDGDFISDIPKEELLLQCKARQKHTSVVGEKILKEGRITTSIIE